MLSNNEAGRLVEQSAAQESGQQSVTSETRTMAESNGSPSASQKPNAELNAGRTRRDAAMWRLSTGKGTNFFEEGRPVFIKLLLVRDVASINDLREVFPPREGVSPNSYGPILMSLSRAGLIRKVGDEPIAHRSAHARSVPRWQLIDRSEAVEWLRQSGHHEPTKSQGTLFGGEGE
jgi:hypothetical protein